MKKILLITLLFLLLFFTACRNNSVILNDSEIENNDTSELLTKLNYIQADNEYSVDYFSKQGKHVVITKNIEYKIKNNEVASMHADFFIGAGTTQPYAVNCTQQFNSSMNDCFCDYFTYTAEIPYEPVFNRTETCTEQQKIKLSDLKTKKDVVELIKTFVQENDLSFDFLVDENCYVADALSGVTVFEKICFDNNNLKSYECDHSYIGLNSVRKWIFN